MSKGETEQHPLGFFLPEHTQLLMLGSFPPPRQRWSMNFFYPNIQNDMWRILGLLFYGDKEFFLSAPRTFDEVRCKAFCERVGLGIGDTAMEVIRQKGNASDKFLEVVKPIDLERVLAKIPECRAVVVTGQKAMDTLMQVLSQLTVVEEPKVGECSSFSLGKKELKLYRMPSSSRAYPKPLEQKAAVYRSLFESLGMLSTEDISEKRNNFFVKHLQIQK